MFNAILLASYGGPEAPEEVAPFLDLILSGTRTSAARRSAVLARYQRFGGVSPLPGECRRFLSTLRLKLLENHSPVKLYWGNLYARPFMDDAFEKMERDGVKNVLVFDASAFGSVVCQRYVSVVRNSLAKRSPDFLQALTLRHVPPFFEMPDFQHAIADFVRKSISSHEIVDSDARSLILFTAHSIPTEWSDVSHYRRQILYACIETLKFVFSETLKNETPNHTPGNFPSDVLTFPLSSASIQIPDDLRNKLRRCRFDSALAFQSRSGSPFTPWLEPDVKEFLTSYKKQNPTLGSVIVVPIGFFFDNMETIFDLDVETRAVCDELGIAYHRTRCCGVSNDMVEAICRLAEKEPDEFPICQCGDGQCDLSCRLNPTF